MGTVAAGVAGALAASALAVLLLPTDPGRLGAAVAPRRRAVPPVEVRPSDGGTVPRPRAARAAPRAEADSRDTRAPHAGSAPPTQGPRGRLTALSPPTLACLLAGIALALLVELPLGLPLGAVLVLAGPRVLARLEPRRVRAQREQLLRDLPLVLDLLASCLVGGASLAAAADVVAGAVGGPAGARLASVGAALSVGAPPGEAWGALAGPDPDRRDTDPLGPAARALARAADGGAPVAAAVSRLAAEARADVRSRGEQAARRVGVLAVAPLGLCFLPAFVLLGIVPVVVGLAGPLLATL